MSKTDHNWFSLSVKLLSDISGSLERVRKVKLRTEKALGFHQIKDHSCLTRPVSPQCLSVPSPVQRDSIPCAVGPWISLVVLEECSGTWCDMAAACSASLHQPGARCVQDMGGDLSQPGQNWRLRARSFVAVDVSEICGRRDTLSQGY